MKTVANFVIAAVFVSAVLSSGCKSFVPGQPNSNQRTEEHIDLTMLDLNAFKTNADYQKYYEKAFGKKPESSPRVIATISGNGEKPLIIPLLIPIAAAAAGAVVNYVAGSISNQAALFQAQFGDTIYNDRFWSIGTNDNKIYEEPNYYGFELKRSVKVGHNRTNAFDLVCGMDFTADEQLMSVKPLTFVTTQAKAKVFKVNWLSWLTELFSSSLNNSGQINSTVDVKCNGYYKDKNQMLAVVPMAAFSCKFQGYNIIQAKTLTATGDANGADRIPEQFSGFLDTAPLSVDPNNPQQFLRSATTGNFALTVNVTEADASNVKEDIEKLGQLISQQKSEITMTITNQISK